MPVTLRSYAKINLGLAIGPARPDGFHALSTLYQTLETHDLLTIAVARRGPASPAIELSCSDERVPVNSRNTVWKMLTLALEAPGREALAVRAHIEKRLPVQGGLGGGSANAAAALLGLERELARLQLAAPLGGDERLRLGSAVGSDVPLFLLGGAVLGFGRGEQVVPLADLAAAVDVVLALPPVGVATPAAFRAWDLAQAARGLTPGEMTARLELLSRALAAAWAEQHASGVLHPESTPRRASSHQGLAGNQLSSLVQTGILLNDFQEVVFRQHPLLEQIQRALAGGALYAALSGSGSAVFGLYTQSAAAEAAEERLNALGIHSLRTRTLGREGYWGGMVVEEG